MEKVTYKATGDVPLIMHNGRLANPFDKFARAMKVITAKRKKTDEELETLAWLEWQGSGKSRAVFNPADHCRAARHDRLGHTPPQAPQHSAKIWLRMT